MMFVLGTRKPIYYHLQDGLMGCPPTTCKRLKKEKYLKNNQLVSLMILNIKKIIVFIEPIQPSSDLINNIF